MKKIWFKVKYFLKSIFYGMSAADNILFGDGESESIVINKETQDKRVSKDLLKGEVTQEVEELRYRTYKVDRESKNFEYYSPTLAKKRDINDSKFVKYENSDNLEIVTIQPNVFLKENIYDAIKNVSDENIKKSVDEYGNSQIEINVGKFKQQKNYTIKLIRNEYAIPRYYLEEYTTRLVVKKCNEENKYILDFYISKYPHISDLKSKGFVREIERIKNEGWKSDIIEFNNVNFITSHAYQLDDMIEFNFKYPTFKEIIEFDGHYIIRYRATLNKQHDIMDDFYSKSMDEKYKNKEAKEVVYNVNGGQEREVYVCEICGKEIVYDTDDIDNKPITQPRLIDEDENIEVFEQVSEYFDIQVVEQTTGQKMCRNCFSEWLKNNNLEKSNIYAK